MLDLGVPIEQANYLGYRVAAIDNLAHGFVLEFGGGYIAWCSWTFLLWLFERQKMSTRPAKVQYEKPPRRTQAAGVAFR